jgi:hypothetical protein
VAFAACKVSVNGLFVMACLSPPLCLKFDIISASLACAVDSVLFFYILFIYSRYFLVAGFNFELKPSWVWRGLASLLLTLFTLNPLPIVECIIIFPGVYIFYKLFRVMLFKLLVL